MYRTTVLAYLVALPLFAAGCHNHTDQLLVVGPCIPELTGTTAEHDSDAATGFSADQVVANLGTRTLAVTWSTGDGLMVPSFDGLDLMVPSFDSLDVSFSLGSDPVQVLSFYSNGSVEDTAHSCPYATGGLRVPLNVSLSSSDSTLVASGTAVVDARAADDAGTVFMYGYTIVGTTVPDDVAAAVADSLASRCDGTEDVYVGLGDYTDGLIVGIGGYCDNTLTGGPAQNDVALGVISTP